MSITSDTKISIAVIAQRFSLSLAVAFVVTVVASSLPVRLLRYDWQYDFANTIRTGTPLAMLAIIFLLIALAFNSRSVISSRYFKVVRQLAGWISLGYFLLIPWQAAAGYFEIQRVDFGARAELTAAANVLDRIEQAATPDELRSVISSVPALAGQLSTQPNALNDYQLLRANLLRNGRKNLNNVKAVANQKNVASLRRFWLLFVQNSLILAAYGLAFAKLASEVSENKKQIFARRTR